MGLSRLENTVLKQFRKDLEQALEGKLVELKLFGSKARGDDRGDSDVDVLVVVSTDDWRISEVIYKVATEGAIRHASLHIAQGGQCQTVRFSPRRRFFFYP